MLTAGALRTPALLMRSGIGPAEHLRESGYGVVADRPGVGENLQNHAVIYVCALLNRLGGRRRRAGPPPPRTFAGPPGARIATPGTWPSTYAVTCPGTRWAGDGLAGTRPAETRIAGTHPLGPDGP